MVEVIDSFQSMRFEVTAQDLQNVDEIDWISLYKYSGWLWERQEGELYQIYCLPTFLLGQSDWISLSCLSILVVL